MVRIVTLFVFLVFSSIVYGQVIISEIMQNPNDVTDASGEWFELYNSGGTTVDINGWTIKDAGTDSHVINNGGPLNITAGGFLVLGRNGDALTNGDVPVDYVYSGITLGNADDELVLLDNSITPVQIDSVAWDGGATFPDPTGASMVYLASPSADNNVGSNWGTATAREPNFGMAGAEVDFGSPGSNGGDQQLPIELTSFVAISGDKEVVLRWSTASEIDNQGYAVLRADDKEGTYDEIDSYKTNEALKGAGNSSSQNNYQFIDNSVFNDETYWYKLVDIDLNGVRTEHGPIYATPHSAEVEEINTFAPETFALAQNKPNPFNPSTSIEFSIPELREGAMRVTLAVFDLLGKKVVTLYDGMVDAGTYKVDWNGSDQAGKQTPSGIYIYQINSENFTQSKRMLLLK
jgi:lamin tail-like protein/flagellar hook capping protein FlgD